MLETFHRLALLATLQLNPVGLFDRINRLPWYRQMLGDWTDTLPLVDGNLLLDCGCATGTLSRELARTGPVVGVDRSQAMLQRAGRVSDGSAVQYVRADAAGLPFADNVFDGVLAASLINLVDSPSKVLAEMARITRAGGWVSVLVPDTVMTDRQVAVLSGSLGLRGFSKAALMSWHRQAPRMAGAALCDDFERAGLCEPVVRSYLSGMVLSVTGRVGPAPD